MNSKLLFPLLLIVALLAVPSEARPFQRNPPSVSRAPASRTNAGNKKDAFAPTGENNNLDRAVSVRGGGVLGKDKSFWIKFHGHVCLFQAFHFILESCGVPIPLMGLTATVKGFNGTDPVTAMILRMAASFFLFAGLMELDYNTFPSCQKHYLTYHINLSVATIVGAMATATGPESYVLPGLVVFSMIAGYF